MNMMEALLKQSITTKRETRLLLQTKIFSKTNMAASQKESNLYIDLFHLENILQNSYGVVVQEYYNTKYFFLFLI